MRTIEIEYTNWKFDDIILNLTKYINDGFSVMTCSHGSLRLNEQIYRFVLEDRRKL